MHMYAHTCIHTRTHTHSRMLIHKQTEHYHGNIVLNACTHTHACWHTTQTDNMLPWKQCFECTHTHTNTYVLTHKQTKFYHGNSVLNACIHMHTHMLTHKQIKFYHDNTVLNVRTHACTHIHTYMFKRNHGNTVLIACTHTHACWHTNKFYHGNTVLNLHVNTRMHTHMHQQTHAWSNGQYLVMCGHAQESLLLWYHINAYIMFLLGIKTHGSELQGQEEAACTHVFWPTQPLQWVIYTDGWSKIWKQSNSTTIAVFLLNYRPSTF